jgi:hypothetical protein
VLASAATLAIIALNAALLADMAGALPGIA